MVLKGVHMKCYDCSCGICTNVGNVLCMVKQFVHSVVLTVMLCHLDDVIKSTSHCV